VGTVARVLVGESRATESLEVNAPRGVTPARQEEGYVIQIRGNAISLVGNDEGPYNGSFFAVSQFLNLLGVRWFMPGEFGTYIPKKSTIEIGDLLLRDAPDFIVRSWSGNLAPELRAEDALWRLHNKMSIEPNSILAIPRDGSLAQYLPARQSVDGPPPLATRADGSLDEHMVSFTNGEAPGLVAARIIDKIRHEKVRDPTFNSVGIAPDDGNPSDLSPTALARSLGFTSPGGRADVANDRSISEEWFQFVNEVARDVAAQYPGFIVTTNGYANRTLPAEGLVLEPNVGVMYAAIWCDLLHPLDSARSWQQQLNAAILRRWTQVSRHVFVYNYNFPMIVTALAPMPLMRKATEDIRAMKRMGVAGFEDEQVFALMSLGIQTVYLRAQLYWKSGLDARALLDDYFSKWYGPASEPSKAFWQAIDDALEDSPILGHEDRVLPYIYSDPLMEQLEGLESRAEALATEEPFRTHVHVDRLILVHLREYRAMNFAEFEGDYGKALEHARNMLELRQQLAAINPFLYVGNSDEPNRRYFSGPTYWNLQARVKHYESLVALTSGKTGKVLGVAPRVARFRIDSRGLGRMQRWFDSRLDRSDWSTVDTGMPFYLQVPGGTTPDGMPLTGDLWYVFEVNVDTLDRAKRVRLYAPIVNAEAWVWTNGSFSGHRGFLEAYVRPAQLDLDVTDQVKAGKNIIGVLVRTSSSPMAASEGFQSRLMLYSPLPPAEPILKDQDRPKTISGGFPSFQMPSPDVAH